MLAHFLAAAEQVGRGRSRWLMGNEIWLELVEDSCHVWKFVD